MILNLILEDPPKDVETVLWIVCGVLASVVISLAIAYHKAVSTNIADKNEQLINQVTKGDKENEKYVLLLEKSMNVISGFDKTLTENSILLPKNLYDACIEGNKPLIEEIKKAIEK